MLADFTKFKKNFYKYCKELSSAAYNYIPSTNSAEEMSNQPQSIAIKFKEYYFDILQRISPVLAATRMQ